MFVDFLFCCGVGCIVGSFCCVFVNVGSLRNLVVGSCRCFDWVYLGCYKWWWRFVVVVWLDSGWGVGIFWFDLNWCW